MTILVNMTNNNISSAIPTTLEDGQYGLNRDGKVYWYEVTNNGKHVDFYTNSYLFDKKIDFTLDQGITYDFDLTKSSGAKESAADNWFPPSNTFPLGTTVNVEEFDVETKADGTLSKVNMNGTTPLIYQSKTYVEALTTDPFTGATSDRKRASDYYSIANALAYSKKYGSFNPPPHKSSRTIAPTAFPNIRVSEGASANTVANLQKVNKRGFFYQDIDTAFDNDGKQKKRGFLWGFQFLYNPTTINYTNSVNNQIDWSNTQDVATALSGSQQFSFSLFLNRLIDISSLKGYETVASTTQCSVGYNPLDHFAAGTDGSYERTLTAEDANGILKRGTEYDLEYFYRVINGDPAIGSSMLSQTSDFGFMSGVPVWLKFNDNVRYKVTVQSISVNHVMFTEDMVPVVTEVALTMIRIPTPKTGSTADVQDWYDQQFKIKNPNWAGSPMTTAVADPTTTDTGSE